MAMKPDPKKCPWCKAYRSYRDKISNETKFRTEFWVALRTRTYRWKEQTSGEMLLAQTLNETRLHYCPRCGTELIAVRHRKNKNGIL